MSKTTGGSYLGRLELYENLVATNPGVKRLGATVPYTSLNGHLFSYLGRTGELALRLPIGAREEFLKRYGATLCRQYGMIQKEYVAVPDALLKKTRELKKYFDLSHDYVASLKPKPAKARSR